MCQVSRMVNAPNSVADGVPKFFMSKVVLHAEIIFIT